jgi:hypothetical protein
MLVKEAVTQIARKLKKENKTDYLSSTILTNYPEDLSRDDIKDALKAISVVSETLLELS